jgi:hypothetical protein
MVDELKLEINKVYLFETWSRLSSDNSLLLALQLVVRLFSLRGPSWLPVVVLDTRSIFYDMAIGVLPLPITVDSTLFFLFLFIYCIGEE